MEGKFKNGLFEIGDIKLENFKAEILYSRNWGCESCKCYRIILVVEKIKNSLIQTEVIKMKNQLLEEQLRVAAGVYKFLGTTGFGEMKKVNSA
jgi:hypothetical protein